MIHARFSPEQIARLIPPHGQWVPFPPASKRDAWERLPSADRTALVAAGEARCGWTWPSLPATDGMAFLRNGNRTRYETPYLARRAALTDLALAACADGTGRFLDDLANGIWAVCEETSWSLPAHLDRSPAMGGLPDPHAPMVDLFAAETAAQLAWIEYLLGPSLAAVSTLLGARIRDEIASRVLDPALARDDFWWMGLESRHDLNNWTPWIVSNWLACILLIEQDPVRRGNALNKAIGCLDRFLEPYPADGGCDEGPMYWTRAAGSLFDALEWLHSASGGQLQVFDAPRVREMGRFLARVHIADAWYVNFADAGPRVAPHPALVYGYGLRTGDLDLQAMGAWLAQDPRRSPGGRPGSMGRLLNGFFTFHDAATATPARPPLSRDAWLPVLEVMCARDAAGSSAGWFVAAKGGHNGESHNHNDVGSLVVYRSGAPLLVDAGVGAYTRQTFSAERYAIWTMQSAWHNLLPTCDGVMQSPGRAFAARNAHWRADDGCAEFRLEIQTAYPPEAGLARWQRTVRLERGRRIVIEDAFLLDRDLGEITLSLLSPSQPTLVAADTLRCEPCTLPGNLPSAAGCVRLRGVPMTLAIETVPLGDAQLKAVWGDTLYRIVIRISHPPRSGQLITEVLPA